MRGTVNWVSVLRCISGPRKLFQWPMNEKRPSVMRAGLQGEHDPPVDLVVRRPVDLRRGRSRECLHEPFDEEHTVRVEQHRGHDQGGSGVDPADAEKGCRGMSVTAHRDGREEEDEQGTLNANLTLAKAYAARELVRTVPRVPSTAILCCSSASHRQARRPARSL